MDNYYNLYRMVEQRSQEFQNEAEVARLGRNPNTNIDAPRQANAIVRLLQGNRRTNRR
ncbi:MAG: hypothetical protein AAF787_16925 [Chloroflexota bacterium]